MTDASGDFSDVIDFWRAAGYKKWFEKDDAFDASFRSRFLLTHEAAAQGDLDHWAESAEGALALLILLDQFPRNSFRGTPRMFATDSTALAVARKAVAAGYDREVDPSLRVFFYLPFEHSEAMADQEQSVALASPLGGEVRQAALDHRDIIRRFGRFPHRNGVLGRTTTAEEQAFLDDGGFAG